MSSEDASEELLYRWYGLLLCYCMLLQGHAQMACNAAIDYDSTQQRRIHVCYQLAHVHATCNMPIGIFVCSLQ